MMEVIFSDVYGPIEEMSIGENLYFVSFIDNFTRKIWIYLIKRKSEVFDVFKIFKVVVENQSECRLKLLRADG